MSLGKIGHGDTVQQAQTEQAAQKPAQRSGGRHTLRVAHHKGARYGEALKQARQSKKHPLSNLSKSGVSKRTATTKRNEARRGPAHGKDAAKSQHHVPPKYDQQRQGRNSGGQQEDDEGDDAQDREESREGKFAVSEKKRVVASTSLRVDDWLDFAKKIAGSPTAEGQIFDRYVEQTYSAPAQLPEGSQERRDAYHLMALSAHQITAPRTASQREAALARFAAVSLLLSTSIGQTPFGMAMIRSLFGALTTLDTLGIKPDVQAGKLQETTKRLSDASQAFRAKPVSSASTAPAASHSDVQTAAPSLETRTMFRRTK